MSTEESHDWAWVLEQPSDTRVVWKDFTPGVWCMFSQGGDFACYNDWYETRIWFTREMFTGLGWTLYEEKT
jgi:hypothetical protein